MPRHTSADVIGLLLDGRYLVTRWLADGGMGSVYVATDTRLQRDVAVKVLRPDLAQNEDFAQRFQREAQLAAQLSHPNIVSVLDHGRDRSSNHDLTFLVMEYVPGRTLRNLIGQHGKLSAAVSVDLAQQILAGLATAHRAGLVHRDIKPENVLITDDGSVKVVDFGLARTVTSRTSATGDTAVYGTVGYLAPEQVHRGIADSRSDVYAVGLVLFEMVTGQKAFTGDHPIEVANQRLHHEVPKPRTRVPELPSVIDTMVAILAARDPDQRPPDAGAAWQVVTQEWARRAAGDPPPDQQTTAALPTQAAASAPPATLTTARAARPTFIRRRLLLLLVLAAIVAAAVGWWYGAGPGATTTVPKLIGLSQEAATQALTANQLQARTKAVFSETVAKGDIISADPKAGSSLHRNTAVTLTVSKGPERYQVPPLKGLSLQKAEAALRADQLRIGKSTQVYDESIERGHVISSAPRAGTTVKPRSSVDITISKGPAPIRLPDLKGESIADATNALTDLRLRVRVGEPEYSSVGKGRVARVTTTGNAIFAGDTVTLTPSKGPKLVLVPAIVGRPEAEAVRQLRAAGFAVQVRRPLGNILGLVQACDPEPGSKAAQGSTVTLTVV